MSLVKVTRNGRVTIPSELRRQIGIEEGDLVELEVVGDHLVLVPKKLINKSQAYFWTPAWQFAERETQADIDEGRIMQFESVDDLLADLQ
ncbi:MAG TPA: AbrB/MazE/SpoVT family DNA-binding domain-containing protein [Anaerolineae bacterium]|nr:AbrB/MazE/SpoVT family DNA-binding domain-containing protein [Anaerolineae bacterium]